jgi:hypothetical protein
MFDELTGHLAPDPIFAQKLIEEIETQNIFFIKEYNNDPVPYYSEITACQV